MKIRLKKPWGRYAAGHIFPEMAGGQGRLLIAGHFAEEIVDERAALSAPVNRMTRPRVTRSNPAA